MMNESLLPLERQRLPYANELAIQMFGIDRVNGALENEKLLSLTNTPCTPVPKYDEQLCSAYSKTPTKKRVTRTIDTTEMRIIDAPGIIDDYHINAVTWSDTNLIIVALGSSLYYWCESNPARQKSVRRLFTLQDEERIMSIYALPGSHYIVVGTGKGSVMIWDIERGLQLRALRGHTDYVSTLDSHGPMLTSGSKDTSIIHWDMRLQHACIATLDGHTDNVVALKWNHEGDILVSAGSEGDMCFWDPRVMFIEHTLKAHTTTVKTLAWCPWQSNLLATGAGLGDGTIKTWNTSSYSLVDTTETNSQVSALVWSNGTHELVSSHGHKDPRIVIWQYPRMIPLVELRRPPSRVLGLSLSPDNTTLLSVHADETLRFWSLGYVPPLPSFHTSVALIR